MCFFSPHSLSLTFNNLNVGQKISASECNDISPLEVDFELKSLTQNDSTAIQCNSVETRHYTHRFR